MSATVTRVETLQQYIAGVMQRAAQHAGNVDEICRAVVGAVIWRKDPGTNLEVRRYAGHMANMLWVWIGGKRYALKYNPTARSIDVCERTGSGKVLKAFTNSASVADVKQYFAGL